jgi:hypothetical protein
MSENKSVTQNGRDPSSGRFLSGNNGGGRPRGSRARLGEAFLADLHAEWEKSGAEALGKCAENEPAQFCKIVANLLPKEIDAQLSIDVDLFKQARSFHEAWLIAQRVIGGEIDDDTPPLIEAEPENGV